MGIDTIINKKLITASNIFRFTMNTDVQAIKCLTGCDAEVLEFIAKPNSPATKGQIRELDFPHDAVIGGHSTGWWYSPCRPPLPESAVFLVRALKEIPDAAGGECVSVGL